MDTAMTDLSFDPFRLGGLGYLLNQIPTSTMAKVMQQLYDGDRIVLARVGKGYSWQGSDNSVSPQTAKALVARQWIVAPGLDLFGERHSGRLTSQGEHALNRFNFG